MIEVSVKEVNTFRELVYKQICTYGAGVQTNMYIRSWCTNQQTNMYISIPKAATASIKIDFKKSGSSF